MQYAYDKLGFIEEPHRAFVIQRLLWAFLAHLSSCTGVGDTGNDKTHAYLAVLNSCPFEIRKNHGA